MTAPICAHFMKELPLIYCNRGKAKILTKSEENEGITLQRFIILLRERGFVEPDPFYNGVYYPTTYYDPLYNTDTRL